MQSIFVRENRTDMGILGYKKNPKFIVVNRFQTLQLVPRSHAVDGCSLRPTAL